MTSEHSSICVMLRTKMAYFRSLEGKRMLDRNDTTACYNCLLTQRPFGPDGMPADPDYCGAARTCFRPDTPG
ncbi:MAG TPA: hypothetical protein VJ728_13890 [Candidatus Binataceae bacterium]|nr:hypothetical protein [Candidatus Binataceae bacterium]